MVPRTDKIVPHKATYQVQLSFGPSAGQRLDDWEAKGLTLINS